MNKLNVLTAMRLGPTVGSEVSLKNKKVKTVSMLPKIHSLDSRMMNDILPKRKKSSGKIMMSSGTGGSKKASGVLGGVITKNPTNPGQLQDIQEGKDGDEDNDDGSSASMGNDDDCNNDEDDLDKERS